MAKNSTFREKYPEVELEGEKVKMKDILNVGLTLKSASTRNSKFHNGKAATLQLDIIKAKGKNKAVYTTTGSQVIVEQVEQIISDKNFPLDVQIVEMESKNGQTYYTFE